MSAPSTSGWYPPFEDLPPFTLHSHTLSPLTRFLIGLCKGSWLKSRADKIIKVPGYKYQRDDEKRDDVMTGIILRGPWWLSSVLKIPRPSMGLWRMHNPQVAFVTWMEAPVSSMRSSGSRNVLGLSSNPRSTRSAVSQRVPTFHISIVGQRHALRIHIQVRVDFPGLLRALACGALPNVCRQRRGV